METQTHTPDTQPTKTPETSRERTLDLQISSARLTIGSFPEHIKNQEEWSEEAIHAREKAYAEKVRSGASISLLELYDHNMDAHRLRVVQILSRAKKDAQGNPQLTDPERNEVIASQLNVSIFENFSSSIDTYMSLFETYRNLKNTPGMATSPGEQEVVAIAHLNGVKTAALERTALAARIRGEQDPAKKAALQKQALELDRTLVKYLMCEDMSVPGANPGGILPIHKQLLYMLTNQYQSIMGTYQEKGRATNQNALRKKLNGVKSDIIRAFPGKAESEIPEAQVLSILQKHGYKSFEEYKVDIDALARFTVDYQLLKAAAKANVQTLAKVTDELGDFQIERARLATVRHHFDQSYALDATGAPVAGTTSPKLYDEMRDLLRLQQMGPIDSIETHLRKVDEGVLKVGFDEKLETFGNERIRTFAARVAHYTSSLQTSWIPDVPGAGSAIRDLAKDSLLDAGLYDALGWPRDDNGRLKDYGDFTDEEKDNLQTKQDSIEKAIKRFEETKALEKLRGSVSVVKKVMNSRNFDAENFLLQGSIDPNNLPQETVTEANLEVLTARYGGDTVTKMCFVQLQKNWDAYGKEYRTLLENFSEIVGIHFDVERHMKNFAKGQAGITAFLLMLLAGGGFIAGASLRYLPRVGSAVVRVGARGGASVLRITGRGAGSLARGGARAFEKATEGLSMSAKVARILAPIGIFLTYADWVRVNRRDMRLEVLEEFDRIQAAIELMEKKGDRTALRYNDELQYLRGRGDALVMQQNALKILTVIGKKYPESSDERVVSLLKRCMDIEKHARHFKDDFEKRFPITDYVVTDPAGPTDNVGFNVRDINDARSRGMEYEEDLAKKIPTNYSILTQRRVRETGSIVAEKRSTEKASDHFVQELKDALAEQERNRPRDPAKNFDDLKEAHEKLLVDIADLLEPPLSKE